MAIFECSSKLWDEETSSISSTNFSHGYDLSECDIERDVRTAITECVALAQNEAWEVVVDSLAILERLAMDPLATAPATSWRTAARVVTTHVRSLRSRVARAACCTTGALFLHRGRALDLELEDAAGALLERCADVNKFLRADAAEALVKVARGGSDVRVVTTLTKRGAGHRSGPVRAAAADALAHFVSHCGASRILSLPLETRTALLRAAGELLADTSEDCRVRARHLCLALAQNVKFRQLLKEAMLPTRYRAIEKYVRKLFY